jgi:hypothetical protein
MSKTGQTGQDSAAAKRTYWGERIAEWERSGQTQKAFCAERNLVFATFKWWLGQGKRAAAMTATPFLPIAMHAGSVVEVELRSRTRIRFEGEAALQAVALLTARVK